MGTGKSSEPSANRQPNCPQTADDGHQAIRRPGSGNHFAEVCLDEHETARTVLRSGSRSIGNQLAAYQTGKAKKLMREYLIAASDPDLAHLTVGTTEFGAHIRETITVQVINAITTTPSG